MLSLKRYNIDFEGAIEGINSIPINKIPLLTLKLQSGGYYYECCNKRFYGGNSVDEGIYGHVDEWLMNNELLVYEKRCHTVGSCLLMEAAMQILVRETLLAVNCQRMVSEVLMICRRDNEVSFMMEPFDKHKVIALHDALVVVPVAAFDRWFVETLAQIVLVMGYLESTINVNHRDLKGDNILINTTPNENTLNIPLHGLSWRLTYHNEIKIVDFGLACKGTAINRPGTLSVGEVFAGREICPKEGRDLYFLLCYFYGMAAFRRACSRKLLMMVERWIGPGRPLEALRTDGLKKLHWINFLINTTSYNCNTACSEILLRDLSVEYPDILQAYK